MDATQPRGYTVELDYLENSCQVRARLNFYTPRRNSAPWCEPLSGYSSLWAIENAAIKSHNEHLQRLQLQPAEGPEGPEGGIPK